MQNHFSKQTKHYLIELSDDLLMLKSINGELLKAVIVPVLDAVDRFNQLVEKIKESESNNLNSIK
jgi:hypothetical protein